MTVRAIAIGLLLGLSISVGVFFNDFVIGNPSLIGHLLPAVVVGFLLALILVFVPLTRLGGVRPLSAAEMAVIAALGLVACSLPDTGFFRVALPNIAMPSYLHATRTMWKAHEVFAHIPGGPARLSEGHVQDWPTLAIRVVSAGKDAPASVLGRVWRGLAAQQQQAMLDLAEKGKAGADTRRMLARAINRIMEQDALDEGDDVAALDLAPPASELAARKRAGETLNERERLTLARYLLVAALPEVVLPPPPGQGIFLMGGYRDPVVVESLMDNQALGTTGVPWGSWWPVLRLWGGLTLLLGAAAFCLTLIVHPQWSRSELLPYPVARLIEGLFERGAGRLLPDVMYQRIFWWGLGAIFTLHLLNGLAVWFPDHPVPYITRQFNFRPLDILFPTASRVGGISAYLAPTLTFSIIAFAYFIPTKVSFSMGIAPLLFILLGTAWLKLGVPVENHPLGAGRGNMLRMGAYMGMAIIIAYTGRQYYGRVLAGMIGLGRTPLPRSTIWAGRATVLCIGTAAALLTTSGLHWTFSVLVVLLLLLQFLVIARIVAETGMFVVQPFWVPVAVFLAVMGFPAMGPTTFIILGLVSTMFVGDTRSVLVGHLINAFQIADRARVQPARVAAWMILMILAGFVTAGAASLYAAYHFDAFSGMDNFTRAELPSFALDRLSWYLSQSSAHDQVAQMTARDAWHQWAAMKPDWTLISWAALGLVLLTACAAARLHLPWWPLHPIAFLVWGTHPGNVFAVSFLIGWALKAAVVSTTGATGYRRGMALAWGVIAGEVTIKCVWLSVGALYYMGTGTTPRAYVVF
ncbi:MAG: DUF6785 family protein [Phycisphaeraceae bacterium]